MSPIRTKRSSKICGLENNQGDARRMVQQVEYQFFSKPSAPKTTLHATSVNPWQQKRTTYTQEVIRRLLRTRKLQNCSQKQRILSEYMQILKNSGYNSTFRKEILKAGIVGYNRILQGDRVGEKPLYRSKKLEQSFQKDGKENQENWLVR